MLEKVTGPSRSGREAMYFADRQDNAYRAGAYEYLHSIAMLPRLAVIASYVRAFGLRRILDVGCGTGDLLALLPPDVTYVGVDIAPTAVEAARRRFGERANCSFYCADFRSWRCPVDALDGVVWAGIGVVWTQKGRGGNTRDWLDILQQAEQPLGDDGTLILELVTGHWPTLERLVSGRYRYETGCDVDCFQSEESPRRSIRVFKKKAHSQA
jgi:SAM-dependent methyltransferase